MLSRRHIKEIELENFQSHKRTLIGLAGAGQLSVITGPTDAGKSTIIRALRWLFYNDWASGYIRLGSDQATVSVLYSDGWRVARTRTRSGAVNRYVVTDPDGEVQVYEGFGLKVPLEVQQITGVRPVEVGDLTFDLNVAGQLETSFLGSQAISGPARAKVLGKLAGTEEVDIANRAVGVDLRRASQEEKELQAEAAELRKQVDELAWVDDLGQKIKQLERLQNLLLELCTRRDTLVQLHKQLNAIREQITSTQFLLQQFTMLDAASIILDEVNQDWDRRMKLERCGERLNELSRNQRVAEQRVYALCRVPEAAAMLAVAEDRSRHLDTLRTLSDRLSGIELSLTKAREWLEALSRSEEANDAVGATESLIERRIALLRLAQKRQALVQAQMAASKQRTRAFETEQSLRQQYQKTLVALGRCPTCGSQIEPRTVASHLKEAV